MPKAEVIISIFSGIKHLFVRKVTFTKPSGVYPLPTEYKERWSSSHVSYFVIKILRLKIHLLFN